MTAEKDEIVKKVHQQISEKKRKLMNVLPLVHSIDDGIVIRFFTNWEQCDENSKIKYVKIDTNNTKRKKYNFFLPKGTILDIRRRKYAGCIMCLVGELEFEVNGKVVHLKAPMERCLENDVYSGRVLKDSYVVTEALPLS